jgi:hypothetical protein
MGLRCSHDAFQGAYSAFRRFRQAVCYVIGGSFPPHKNRDFPVLPENLLPDEPLDENTWYWDADKYSHETHPGLSIFLLHHDDRGEISPEDCVKVANDLEALIPELEKLSFSWGHIERDGGFAAVCRKFVNGCREAARLQEPLIFA